MIDWIPIGNRRICDSACGNYYIVAPLLGGGFNLVKTTGDLDVGLRQTGWPTAPHYYGCGSVEEAKEIAERDAAATVPFPRPSQPHT